MKLILSTKTMHTKIINRITDKFFCLVYTLKTLLNFEEKIYCWWWESHEMKNNWGDAYNYYLLEKNTNKKIVNASRLLFRPQRNVHCMTGSILQSIKGRNIIIWGSGFISNKYEINKNIKNIKIRSVRGPLTRDVLISQGVDCPEIYGDPALLMPRFYAPRVKKKYKLGVIPHYIDNDINFIKRIKNDPEIKLIDITGGIERVVDEINMCEKIISSTLHGLILADAYKIPSLWIRLSDNIIGGNFKFHDYLLSVNKKKVEPVPIDSNTDLKEVAKNIKYEKTNINLDKLINSCPINIKATLTF